MHKKSLAALTVIIIIVSMVLAACSTQGTTTNTASDSETSNEKITITIWTGHSSVTVLKQMVGADLLQQKYPNYTFNFLSSNGKGVPSLQDYLAEKTPIDIYVESIGSLAEDTETGLQYDMTQLIKKHNLDLNSLDQVSVQYVKSFSNGGFWTLPLYADTTVLYYNKDLFDKFGVAYPKDGMTWDEMRGLAQKMTRNESGVQYYGLSAEWIPHILNMNQLSLSMIDPKTNKSTLTANPKWVEFIQTLYLNNMSGSEMQDYINSNKSKLPGRNDFIKNKNLVMMTGLAAYAKQIPELQQNVVNWDMVSLPTFKDNPDVGPQEYPTYMGVASTSQHKDAAMEMLKYLVSKEFQDNVPLNSGGIPVLNASKGSYTQNANGKNLNAVFYHKFATIAPKTKYDYIAADALNTAIPKIIAANMDLNTGLRSVAEEVDKKIMEVKQ